MENASKALLLGGGILIGLIVMSIGVYIFSTYSGNATSVDQNRQATEIKKFNVNFTKFEGRDDITIQEIVTLINFAEQYEKENGIHIQISIGVKTDIINWLKSFHATELEDKKVQLIQDNSEKIFKCKNMGNQDIKYDIEGKIWYIKFSEKT